MNEPDLSPSSLTSPTCHLPRPVLSGRVVLILLILMATLALGSSAFAFSDHNAEQREAALQRREPLSGSSTVAAPSARAFRSPAAGAVAAADPPADATTSAAASPIARNDLALRVAGLDATRRDAARRYAALRDSPEARPTEAAALPASRRIPPYPTERSTTP
ncbi:hypothetical protein [Roseateles amylovorans]|uniref:Uncharacterized protein n=1 Tax=Roseateles amylovorans TaxID=2978473 RepID=A0ABY6AUS1_9BURK|nr:hypothetical protein [Roseateles amylovorans]UXH76964.1 hypothetical protein N4261_18300 [Roseateles amylovorans]